MSMRESLADKCAIVTGAGGSLGHAIAERLLSEGCRLVLADVDGESAVRAQRTLDPGGHRTLAVQSDVTVPEEAAQLADRSSAAFGGIDLLVNNAGVLGPVQPLVDIDEAAIDTVIAVNLKGVIHCLRAVLPYMRGSGSVVTIASTAGKEGPANLSLYAATKAAVIGLTKSVARECVADGVRVNCVSPTLIADTGMEIDMGGAFRDGSIARIPMGRPARCAEVAAVVAFLLSAEASFVTGQCYDVSGGRSVY